MDECKPLEAGAAAAAAQEEEDGAGSDRSYDDGGTTDGGRSLHSSTFRLNVSTPCEGHAGWIQWSRDQKRLRLSREVDECKPLDGGTDYGTDSDFMSSMVGRCRCR